MSGQLPFEPVMVDSVQDYIWATVVIFFKLDYSQRFCLTSSSFLKATYSSERIKVVLSFE